MSVSRPRLLLVAVALATVSGVAGCGDGEAHVPMAADRRGEGTWVRDQPTDDLDEVCVYDGEVEPCAPPGYDPPEPEPDLEPAPSETPPPSPVLPPATNGVRLLYDGTWTVEEGQWSLDASADLSGIPSFRRLLESTGGATAWINVPGEYGDYRTRIQLHASPPPVPGWCQDAGEVSIRVRAAGGGIVMGSFETYQDLPVTGPGWYRLRYCTEKQDLAASQDEFTGDEYTTYAGRHLIQLWHAPQAPDVTLRLGSRWARELGRG